MKKQLSKVMAAALVVSSVPAVALADTTSEKLVGENRIETAIKVSKSNWKTADTVVLVNEKAIADALAITPLAEEKNAPILLTGKDGLNKSTKAEIQRLGAKNVILAGGNSVLSEKLEKELKELNLNIDRIAGKNREETSLEILKRLDNINDISEVVVVNGTTGLADAVSIAAVAAKNNMGIILANPKNGVKVFEEFIKNEDIKKSYIIGGDKALPNKLVESLPSKERISGSNRSETNIKILEKFYTAKKLEVLYVAKDGMNKEDQLVDALAIGVVAAKNSAPVLIVSNKLKDSQKEYINSKKIGKVVQSGGNGNEKAFEEVVNDQKTTVYKVESVKELEEALKKANANDKIQINFDTKEEIIITTNSSVVIENNGNLGNIKLEGSNADITNKGTIGKLEIDDSNNVEIKNESAGKIENIENNGTGTQIDNDGKIDKVTGDVNPSIDGNKPGSNTGGGSSSGGNTGGSTGGETEETSTPNFNNESLMIAIEDLSKDKENIKIKFLDKIPSDINGKNPIDVSFKENDEKVFAFSEDTTSGGESYTTIYVAADGKVVAPESLIGLFGFEPIYGKITDIDLTNLDTSNVTNMSGMFEGCSNLTSLDLSKLDTSNVTDMSVMFHGCSGLTSLNLKGLNTASVTNMASIFDECRSIKELDLSAFDTSKATDISGMFFGCSSLTSIINLEGLNTSSVTDMSGMFDRCTSLTSLDLTNLDTSKVTTMYAMFNECKNLKNIDGLSKLDTSKVENMEYMFSQCTNLSGSIKIMNPGTKLYNMMFNDAVTGDAKFELEYVDDATKSIARDIVRKFNNPNITLKVSREERTFSADKLKDKLKDTTLKGVVFEEVATIPEGVENISESENGSVFAYKDKSNVLHIIAEGKVVAPEDLTELFNGCVAESIDLSDLDTSNVKNMHAMFGQCSSLTDLNLSNLDTSKVTDMSFMFAECIALENVDLSGFNTSNVENMKGMFINCEKLSGNITIMNKIQSYLGMFDGAATGTNGAKFTVNYIDGATKEVATEMVDTANGNPNVVLAENPVTFPTTKE